jgi:hypothetical protein
MMQNLLMLDTDVMIDYLKNYQQAIDYIEKSRNPFLISAITVAELFTGIRNEQEQIAVESILTTCDIISIDYDIAQIGGTFRGKYSKSHGTSLMDALIAATALHCKATLITLNVKHFPMVKTIKPYKK